MAKSITRSTTGIDQFLTDNSTCGRIMRNCLDYARKHEIDLSEGDVDNLHGLLQFTEIGLLDKMSDYEVSLMVRSYNAGKNTRKP